MGGRNDFLKKRDERDRRYYEAGMQMGIQLVHDFMQMALRDPEAVGKDVFGRSRIEKLFKRVSEYDHHFHLAFTDHVEADKIQEEMDSVLREIYGDELVPFNERYPYAKTYGYTKARKGWVE